MPKRNRNQDFSKNFMNSLNGEQLGEAFEMFVQSVEKDSRPKSYQSRSFFERRQDAALKKASDEVDLNAGANSATGPLTNKNVQVAQSTIEDFFAKELQAKTLPAGAEARHARLCFNPGRIDCPVCKGVGEAVYNKQQRVAIKRVKEDMADRAAQLKALMEANKKLLGIE